MIPDRCDFVIDIRPTEQYSNEEILAELQSICCSELKARNLANRSSATFEDSPLQKAAERLGIETFSSPTTSDWLSQLYFDINQQLSGLVRNNDIESLQAIKEVLEDIVNK